MSQRRPYPQQFRKPSAAEEAREGERPPSKKPSRGGAVKRGPGFRRAMQFKGKT